jgi:hypothetical protein
MREAGYKRALEFSDEHVMELWAGLMAEVEAKRWAAGA